MRKCFAVSIPLSCPSITPGILFFTNFPVLRSTERKGIKVDDIGKRIIYDSFIENVITESEYLKFHKMF
jgi:hypothetical protein